jgi:4-hydroxy-tetrahydrodipicolinate synthase
LLKLEGCFVALLTPMKKNGELDETALRQLIDLQIEEGTQGLIPCGTTGESATLTVEEHKRVIDISVDQVNGRIPVLAGTGSNATSEALDLTKHAENAGCDGALLITPYYNKPTPKGLIQHFTTIANATNLPLVVYNVPSRTSLNMEPSTVLELAKLKNIVGIKEASGNLGQVMDIIAKAPAHFAVISGDDALTYPIVALGGKGVISVIANIAPKLMSTFVKSLMQGNYEKARKEHYALLPLFKVLFIETNPGPCKKAAELMNLAGSDSWYLRLPLVEPSSENTEKIRQVLQQLKLL